MFHRFYSISRRRKRPDPILGPGGRCGDHSRRSSAKTTITRELTERTPSAGSPSPPSLSIRTAYNLNKKPLTLSQIAPKLTPTISVVKLQRPTRAIATDNLPFIYQPTSHFLLPPQTPPLPNLPPIKITQSHISKTIKPQAAIGRAISSSQITRILSHTNHPHPHPLQTKTPKPSHILRAPIILIPNQSLHNTPLPNTPPHNPHTHSPFLSKTFPSNAPSPPHSPTPNPRLLPPLTPVSRPPPPSPARDSPFSSPSLRSDRERRTCS